MLRRVQILGFRVASLLQGRATPPQPHQGQVLRALRGRDPAGAGEAMGSACAQPSYGVARLLQSAVRTGFAPFLLEECGEKPQSIRALT